MSNEKEQTIRRVPREESGVKDSVEALGKCSIAEFDKTNGEVTGVRKVYVEDCKIMASYENGTFSVSVRGETPFMVSVRLDETMALLKEAAEYAMEGLEKEEKQ